MSAFYNYTLDIEHLSGSDTLVSVTVNGTIYTAPTPFVMSAVNAPYIITWLNTAIPAYIWLSEYTTDNITGLSYLNIYTSCLSEATSDVITAEILRSNVSVVVVAVVQNCGSASCTRITAVITAALEIDCVRQCLNFTDTTGFYSLGNPTGYGSPNYPAISDINSITFTLEDASGTPIGSPYTSTYRPTDPYSSVCLTPDNFAIASFTGNTVYKLKYTFLYDTVRTCAPLTIPFRMPCCGAVLPSGLAVSFILTQQNGNGNPTPKPTSLIVTDTTLAYSTTNLGGYGTPNPDFSAISHTEFVVTRPDGEIVSFDNGYIPTALNTQSLITNENLGYGAGIIPDGLYKVVYNVYAIPASAECLLATTTVYTLLFQNTYNCLYNQGISLLSGCDLQAKTAWNANWNELEMIIAASLTNVNCVAGKLERLLAQCQSNCPTC